MMLSFWEKDVFIDYDYIVVGSGIVGLSTAIELAETDKQSKILVLEKGIFPTGASTKNAGFACFGSLTELLDDLKTLTEAEVVALVKMRFEGLKILRSRLGDAAIDYKHYGGYELISESLLPCLDKMDDINKILKPYFGDEVFSLADEKIATFGFSSNFTKHLVYNQFEGQIHTGKMMQSLLAYAQKLGITILTGAEVIDFDTSTSLSNKIDVSVMIGASTPLSNQVDESEIVVTSTPLSNRSNQKESVSDERSRKTCSEQSRKTCSEQSRKTCGEQSRKTCGEQSQKTCGEQSQKTCGEQSQKTCGERSRKTCGERSRTIEFSAKKVAICTNAFTQKFQSKLDVKLDLEPGRGQVLITEPIKDLKFKGVFHIDEGYLYMRNYENRVIFGGGRNIAFQEEATTQIMVTEKITNYLIQYLDEFLLPDQPYRIAHQWAGIMAFGKNKQPFLQVISDKVVFGVRLGGMGVAIGSGLGKEIAKKILK